MEATLSKVGNSMAVLLPKALRQQASIDAETPLKLETPRKGVVVITAVVDDHDRLERFRSAQSRLGARSSRLVSWPEGMTADDMIEQGKKGVADELLSP